jgi:hypothetical protein
MFTAIRVMEVLTVATWRRHLRSFSGQRLRIVAQEPDVVGSTSTLP